MARDVGGCIGAIKRAELIADAKAGPKLLVGQPQYCTAPVFGAQHFTGPAGIVFSVLSCGPRKQTNDFTPPPGAVGRAASVMDGSQIQLSKLQRFHEIGQVTQLLRRRHLIYGDISVAWHGVFLFPVAGCCLLVT